MAKIRVIQIVEGPQEIQLLKILPGTFNNHREAEASIAEDGEFVFLESHSLKAAKTNDDGQKSNG